MEESLTFYRDMLGFETVRQAPSDDAPNWVFLKHGATEIMLNTMYENDQRPSHPDPARVAAHRDTEFYMGTADVDGMYAYLRSQGVSAEPPANRDYGMRQTYIRDPDGYTLCFQAPVV